MAFALVNCVNFEIKIFIASFFPGLYLVNPLVHKRFGLFMDGLCVRH